LSGAIIAHGVDRLSSRAARYSVLLAGNKRFVLIRSADGADNIGAALLLELPAADAFWNSEPFAKTGGYQGDARVTRWVFGD
jgi:hypothetical protein